MAGSIPGRKTFHNLLKNRHSVFYKILLYFFVPILIILITSISTYIFYKNWFERKVVGDFAGGLEVICSDIDKILHKISHTNTMISSNEAIKKILYHKGELTPQQIFNIYKTIQKLRDYRTSMTCIYNVFLYQKDLSIVISASGAFSAASFFDDCYQHEKYSWGFWNNYYYKGEGIDVLPPSRSRTYGVPGRVIPVVQNGIGEFISDSVFVVDIDESEWRKTLHRYEFTPQSIILIADPAGRVFSTNDYERLEQISNHEQVIQEVIARGESHAKLDIEGSRYLAVYHEPPPGLKDFVFMALVPRRDLNVLTRFMKTVSYIAISAGALVAIVLSLLMSFNIFKPIKGLVKVLGRESTNSIEDSDEPGNEFDYLSWKLRHIVANESFLEKRLSTALPLAYERIMFRILRDGEADLEEDLRDFLREQDNDFLYTRFCAVIIRFHFSEHFSEKFSNEERFLIVNNSTKLAAGFFDPVYRIYPLRMDGSRTCLLLNLPGAVDLEEIRNQMTNLCHALREDQKLLRLFVGIGRIHDGLEGMRRSFREADHVISGMLDVGEERVQLYTNETDKPTYRYPLVEENKLLNYLLAGDEENVVYLADKIFDENSARGIAENELKELCLHIHNTGMRALNRLEKAEIDLMGKAYFEIASEYPHQPLYKIKDYLLSFLSEIAKVKGPSCRSLDVKGIVDYIKRNYKEDIYLDLLSDKYHTSSRYLSRILKKKLRCPFHEYLARLRIDDAKTLLMETEKSVVSIASEVGYMSLNTFYRVFKKMEGITPSQYRGLYQAM